MIFAERPSPYENRFQFQPKPPAQEYTVKFGKFYADGMSYRLMLKENSRGRFLRITAKTDEHFGSVIIPGDSLNAFADRLGKFTEPAAMTDLNPITEQWAVGRKRYELTLAGDTRGRFLHIVEKIDGYLNTVVVAASGLAEFKQLLDDMVKANKERALIVPSAFLPQEKILQTGVMLLECRAFTFQLVTNAYGRCLRITEDKQGVRKSITIPSEGVEEFKKYVVEMAKLSKKLSD